MTVAPKALPVSCTTVEAAVALLRERGFRAGTPRRLMLEELFRSDTAMSAEEIATRLRLDLTSVYRNLELFQQQGLVRHVHLGHGPGRYGLLVHGEREYLYCETCHAVKPVAPEALDPIRDELRARFGFQARFTHFPITGTCPDCLAGGGE